MANVDIKVRTTQTGAADIQKLRGQYNQLKDTLKNLAGGAALAGAALYGVIQTAERGQKIEQLSRSFDSLSQSVGSTADVMLGRLREATMGMVSDFDLMLAGNRFLSMGLASSADEAGRLAEMAITLGSAMGKDAGPAMEEFALLLANQSIPRLDTFGISAGRVRTRIQELQEATPGLTRETAFLQAVMEEAGDSMERVGDVAVNGASAFKAQLGNAIDLIVRKIGSELNPILEDAAEGLERLVQLTQNEMGEATADMIDGNTEAAKTIEELVAAGSRLRQTYLDIGSTGRLLTGTNDEMEQGFRDTLVAIAEQSDSLDEYREAVKRVIDSDNLLIGSFGVLEGEVTDATEAIYAEVLAAQTAEVANGGYSDELERLARMGREAALGQEDAARAALNYGEALRGVKAGAEEAHSATDKLTDIAAATEDIGTGAAWSRDRVDELKREILGIKEPDPNVARAFYELYKDARDADDAIEDVHEELDGLEDFYEFELRAQVDEANTNIRNLEMEAMRVARLYELHFRIITEGEVPHGGPQAPGDEGTPPQGPGGNTGGGGGGNTGGGGDTGGGPGGHQGPPEFALGGYTGTTGGTVHPGEYVLPPAAVAKYGIGLLEQMRNGNAAGAGLFAPTINLVLPNYTGSPTAMGWQVISKVGEVYGNRMK